MRSVRRKKTIENNNPKYNDDLISTLPLDLITEILTKLPAESIAKLYFVSKLWSSIIGHKDFTELYLTRSSTRPRLLFSVRQQGTHFFHSCSQEDPSSDYHCQHRLTTAWNSQSRYEVCPPIRGLICCHNNTQVVICNPSTGQFLNLPQLEAKRTHKSTFFGNDPVNDVYKVLCTTTESHQVFTLGSDKQETWRMIKCKYPHFPSSRTKGLCMNGFLYYYSWINGKLSLIVFDLRTEDFNIIKLPEDVRLEKRFYPVNYIGMLALARDSFNGTVDLLVLEDASKQEWSKVSVLIPSWRDLVGKGICKFMGVLGSGELIFTPPRSTKPFYILYYNLKENNVRKVVIEEIGDDFSAIDDVFLDHVESPMFLPKLVNPLITSFSVGVLL